MEDELPTVSVRLWRADAGVLLKPVSLVNCAPRNCVCLWNFALLWRA